MILIFKKLLSDLMQNFKLKIKSLVCLSNCCKVLKSYNNSIKFLKKALQYCWHINNQKLELNIYELLG